MKYLLGGSDQPAAGDAVGAAASKHPDPRQPSHHVPAKIHKSPPQGFEFVNSKPIHRPKTTRRPLRAPANGVRAPRCSVMTDITSEAAKMPPPSPRRVPGSIPESPSNGIEQTPWQDYDIPDELAIVKKDIPEEIKNIIQESLDEHRAMRASRLQAQTIVVRTTVERNTQHESQGPISAEQAGHVPAHSPSASDYPTDRSGSSLSNAESATSVESDHDDQLLRPPKAHLTARTKASSGSLHSKASAQSLGSESSSKNSSEKTVTTPTMSFIESKMKESKDRTIKSRKLFKLLPSQPKSKSQLSRSGLGLDFLMPYESTTYECTSCFDDVPSKVAVDGLLCRHKYCAPCFSQLVSTSIASESTFPPKCCLQEIPKSVIRTHLKDTEVFKYDAKALEYAVPIPNRFYCPSPPCARWIDTRYATRNNGALECPFCSARMCMVCRGPSHPSNQDCPQDYGLNEALEQAERQGWRRCHSCRTLVERNEGCRHITCKCRAEFWYVCFRPLR